MVLQRSLRGREGSLGHPQSQPSKLHPERESENLVFVYSSIVQVLGFLKYMCVLYLKFKKKQKNGSNERSFSYSNSQLPSTLYSKRKSKTKQQKKLSESLSHCVFFQRYFNAYRNMSIYSFSIFFSYHTHHSAS